MFFSPVLRSVMVRILPSGPWIESLPVPCPGVFSSISLNDELLRLFKRVLMISADLLSLCVCASKAVFSPSRRVTCRLQKPVEDRCVTLLTSVRRLFNIWISDLRSAFRVFLHCWNSCRARPSVRVSVSHRRMHSVHQDSYYGFPCLDWRSSSLAHYLLFP